MILIFFFGRSGVYGAFLGFLTLICLAVVPLLVTAGLYSVAFQEIATETRYHKEYRDKWKEVYEKERGSLSQAHVKLAVEGVSPFIIGGLIVYAYKQIAPALGGSRGVGRRRTKRRSA